MTVLAGLPVLGQRERERALARRDDTAPSTLAPRSVAGRVGLDASASTVSPSTASRRARRREAGAARSSRSPRGCALASRVRRRSTASAASSVAALRRRGRGAGRRAAAPARRACAGSIVDREHRIGREGSGRTGALNQRGGAPMPTYIMLSTLTPEGVQTVKNNPAAHPRGQQRGRAARRHRQGAVGDARPLRLRQRRRGARREDDGARLARARLARHGALRVARRDPDRRLHRLALSALGA